jgi:ribonuclease-3
LAFIHRSIVNERPDFAPKHNERIEFLWDAVLELIITEKLYLDFPEKPEWELTDIRSALVRWRNLAIISRELNFMEYLILWKWEVKSWWKEKDYILANTFEAFLWAIYLDLWYEKAKEIVLKYVYSKLEEILEEKWVKDYKSLIQEYSQAEFAITPRYEILEHSWPDHDKIYISWIYLKDKEIWRWEWSSKKKSQEAAAENAYKNLTLKK